MNISLPATTVKQATDQLFGPGPPPTPPPDEPEIPVLAKLDKVSWAVSIAGGGAASIGIALKACSGIGVAHQLLGLATGLLALPTAGLVGAAAGGLICVPLVFLTSNEDLCLQSTGLGGLAGLLVSLPGGWWLGAHAVSGVASLATAGAALPGGLILGVTLGSVLEDWADNVRYDAEWAHRRELEQYEVERANYDKAVENHRLLTEVPPVDFEETETTVLLGDFVLDKED